MPKYLGLIVAGCLFAVGAAAAPGRYAVTTRSAGPVRLGMTLRQVRGLAGVKLKRSRDGEGLALVAVSKGGAAWMTLYANEPDPDKPLNLRAKVENIEVTSGRFATAAGVRPGMKIAAVERIYGPLREIRRSEIESREFATFARGPKGLTFRVTAPGGSAGVYGKGEVTRKLAPGAGIASITLSGR
jgi:hypothetical protein